MLDRRRPGIHHHRCRATIQRDRVERIVGIGDPIPVVIGSALLPMPSRSVSIVSVASSGNALSLTPSASESASNGSFPAALCSIEQRVTVVGVGIVTNPIGVGVNRLGAIYRECIEIIVDAIGIGVGQ